MTALLPLSNHCEIAWTLLSNCCCTFGPIVGTLNLEYYNPADNYSVKVTMASSQNSPLLRLRSETAFLRGWSFPAARGF